jgi:hypothetical protein
MHPLFANYSANATLCTHCKDFYVDLKRHFMNMTKEYDENNMCMDVVDQVFVFSVLGLFKRLMILVRIIYICYKFNYTRIVWSKGYKCNYRDIDEMNILIISGSFIVATITFYITVRLIVQEEKRQFIQIRKFIFWSFVLLCQIFH